MATKHFVKIDVKQIAQLAQIPTNSDEEKKLSDGFTKTLVVVDQLNKLQTDDIEPTHQVTGLANVFREDIVVEKRMLSQKQALQNAKKTYAGYFVAKQILVE